MAQGLLAGAVAAVTGAVMPYGYPAYAGYAAAPVAVPAPYAGVPTAHGLGLPEAATFVAPPVRTVAEAPIVEQVKTLKEKKKAFFVGILEFG